MFAPHTLPAGTIDQELARRRDERWRAMRANRAAVARLEQAFTEHVRAGDDEGDWKAAGFSSSAQWVAAAGNSDYRTAERIASTSEALRTLPKIDEKFRAGELSSDQTAAAVANATPETDAQIARLAPGKAPGQIAIAVRELNPPTAADDAKLYKRRRLSLAWTPDRSELEIHGRLPHELGVLFENTIWDIAKKQRADDKKHGVVLDWQQSTADALVSLARRDGGAESDATTRRNLTTIVVHLSEDGPAVLQGSGVISAEKAERLACDGRFLFLKPDGDDLMHSRLGRNASIPQKLAMLHRSKHCQYPGCTNPRDLEAHHMTLWAHGGKTEIKMMILLCPHHHDSIHEHGIRVTGTGENPMFASRDRRPITADQPHVPPG